MNERPPAHIVPIAAGVLYPFFGMMLSPIITAAAMSFSSVWLLVKTALDLLKERYARGEIDREEYLRVKAVLEK